MDKIVLTLTIFISLATFAFGQKGLHRESLLCNTENYETDRLLFYDKDCFIWISHITTQSKTVISVSFGNFKTVGDTIYFMHPDSTKKANKYFCYCKYKGQEYTDFHIYNVPETWPPGSIDRVYMDLFKTKTPNLDQMTTIVQFKAIKRDNRVVFLNRNGKTKNEYSYCKIRRRK